MHMKSKIILALAVIIIVGGGAFLTLNKKTEAPTTNNGTGLQNNNQINTYDTDNDGENESETDDDNKNTTAQKPTIQPTKTTGSSSYTLAQVTTHNSQTDCWTVVNGSVYNITSYITRHPGGVRAISSICGKDGTSTFDDQHGGQSRPENTLSSFLVGSLK